VFLICLDEFLCYILAHITILAFFTIVFLHHHCTLMDMSPKDILLLFLARAYAAEIATIVSLEGYLQNLEQYPEVREKFVEHMEQSRAHSRMIKQCVTRLEGDTNILVSTSIDEMEQEEDPAQFLQTLIEAYAQEHREMALYNTLVTAAQELGDPETADIARDILQDEVDMASWINDQLPTLVQNFIQSQE
jgi:ferritin-like metal-binding protein YciE